MKDSTKNLWGRIVDYGSKKMNELEQKQAQKRKEIAEQNRKYFEFTYGTTLRKRMSLALNCLPSHMRTSGTDIDSNSLSITCQTAYWELQTSLSEPFSRAKCKGIHEHLNEILNNQFQEAYQDFNQRINSDANEYVEQQILAARGDARAKEAFVFASYFNKFANANYYRLVNIEIINIECIENKLIIQFKADDSIYRHFCNNYWSLISR